MKKILLFGALGALGCLVAWGTGELFLKVSIPWATAIDGVRAPSILTPPEPPQLSAAAKPKVSEQLTVPTPKPPPTPEPFRVARAQEPPPPTDAELARRLQEAGAHRGQVEVALIWYNVTDLDLHVFNPSGEEIFFNHKKAQSGGELDVDRNVTQLTTTPVEHVYFPENGAPNGHYRVAVVCFTDRINGSNQYKVEVMANGERRTFEGSITNYGRSSRATNYVCAFDVEAPTPELRVSLPENVSIIPDGSNDFRVRIARGYFDEPVMLRLEPTSGLSIDPAQIPKGESVGNVTLHASGATTAGQASPRLIASAETPRGHVEESANLRVSIIAPPKVEPVLRIAAPRTVQVLQGDANRFKVRVGRYFFPTPGPVTLRVESSNGDLTSSDTVVPATGDEAVMEVNAKPGALTGKHDVRLVATTTAPPAEIAETVSFDVIARPLPQIGWATVATVALWTALLAIGLSLLLIAGQNHYLRRHILAKDRVFLEPVAVSDWRTAFSIDGTRTLIATDANRFRSESYASSFFGPVTDFQPCISKGGLYNCNHASNCESEDERAGKASRNFACEVGQGKKTAHAEESS